MTENPYNLKTEIWWMIKFAIAMFTAFILFAKGGAWLIRKFWL